MTRPSEWPAEAEAHHQKSQANQTNALLKMDHISSLVNKINGSRDKVCSPGTPVVKEAAITPYEQERETRVEKNRQVMPLSKILLLAY